MIGQVGLEVLEKGKRGKRKAEEETEKDGGRGGGRRQRTMWPGKATSSKESPSWAIE